MNKEEAMEKATEMLNVMEAGNDLRAVVNEAFHHIGLAEEVLGDNRKISLNLMMTTDPLRGYSDKVYKSHVKELLDRALAKEDTRPGTVAEILCTLSNSSLKAPLSKTGLMLMEHCFHVCFPDMKVTATSTERWKGELDSEIREARHMLWQDWRK